MKSFQGAVIGSQSHRCGSCIDGSVMTWRRGSNDTGCFRRLAALDWADMDSGNSVLRVGAFCLQPVNPQTSDRGTLSRSAPGVQCYCARSTVGMQQTRDRYAKQCIQTPSPPANDIGTFGHLFSASSPERAAARSYELVFSMPSTGT